MARCELSTDSALHFVEQVIGLLRASPATSVRGVSGVEVPRIVWVMHGRELRAIASRAGLTLAEAYRHGLHVDSVWLVVRRGDWTDGSTR